MRARVLNEFSGNVASEEFNDKVEIDWRTSLTPHDFTKEVIVSKDEAENIIRELRRMAAVIEKAINDERTLWVYAGVEDGLT